MILTSVILSETAERNCGISEVKGGIRAATGADFRNSLRSIGTGYTNPSDVERSGGKISRHLEKHIQQLLRGYLLAHFQDSRNITQILLKSRNSIHLESHVRLNESSDLITNSRCPARPISDRQRINAGPDVNIGFRYLLVCIPKKFSNI
jgi:hypothetical protein